MTRVQLAKRVAEVVVYGHVLLFLFAIYVYFATPYDRGAVVPMVLMGAPTLGLVAVSAFKYLSDQVPDNEIMADPSWSRVALGGSVLFLMVLAVIYFLATRDHELRIEDLQYATGVTETVLGVYLGIIRDKLFPEVPEPPLAEEDEPAGNDAGTQVEGTEGAAPANAGQ